MKVKLSYWLQDNLTNFDEAIQRAVFEFIVCVQTKGFKGLEGRNKSSVLPNPRSKKAQENAKIAQKYCLWHYHLGVPCYVEQANGDKTSQYILHYCYYDEVIVLVSVGVHPPFVLPSGEKLNY